MKKSLSLLSCNTTQKTMESPRHTRRHMLRAAICRALLPLGLLLLAMPAFGQTYVGNASNCIGTITRSNDDGTKRIHYVKNGQLSGDFFSDFTPGSPESGFTCHSITGYDITDFVVFNDTVYICGEDANGVGFYGWTSAPNTLNASWTFHIYKLYNNSSTFINQLLRIRVFRSGSDLNVLLIGMYKQSGTNSYSSIIHVKNNDTCTLAYQNDDCFYDIAILNDYVVTIEEKGGIRNHNGHQMRVLYKSSFSLYDGLFDYYHAWGQVQSVGRLWFQAADGNNLVSVYRDERGYYFNAYSVSSGFLIFHKYYTVLTSSMPTIGDVAYNSHNKTLAILHNIDTVGTATFYNCTSFPTITLSSSEYPALYNFPNPDPQTKLLSVTKRPSSSNFVVTGICQNKPVFWNTTYCGEPREIPLTSANSSIERLLWSTIRTTMNTHYSTFTSLSSSCRVTNDCEALAPWPVGDGDKN